MTQVVSLNGRAADIVRDVWSNPLARAGPPTVGSVAQDTWLSKLSKNGNFISGQPVPVLGHCCSKKVFSDV